MRLEHACIIEPPLVRDDLKTIMDVTINTWEEFTQIEFLLAKPRPLLLSTAVPVSPNEMSHN